VIVRSHEPEGFPEWSYGMISIMPVDTISGGVPLLGMARMSAVNFTTPGWFSALGTRIVAGRDVSDRDRKGTPAVVVANRAFARKFLNGASPLGHTIATAVGLPGHPLSIEVVGVVEDAVHGSQAQGHARRGGGALVSRTAFP
jgi:hypothetical protein